MVTMDLKGCGEKGAAASVWPEDGGTGAPCREAWVSRPLDGFELLTVSAQVCFTVVLEAERLVPGVASVSWQVGDDTAGA